MQRFKTKIRRVAQYISNFIHKKKLIIFVGHNSIFICAIKNKKIIKELYILYEQKNFFAEFKKIIWEYQNFYVTFLLDTKNSKLTRQIIPVVDSIVKINPVEKFIEQNYPPEEIVAYNVYNINRQEGEAWNTLIGSSKYSASLRNMIEYVIKFAKYDGCYLFTLEVSSAIQQLLSITHNQKYKSHLQIFVTILQDGIIKIVIKRRNNILYDLSFPFDNSCESAFLKGMIEQLISEQIINCKEYIARHNSEICIILLLGSELRQELEQDPKFCAAYNKIFISPQDLKFKDDISQERVICKLISNKMQYPAFNHKLKQLANCQWVNLFLSKPLLVIILVLLAKLISVQYDIRKTQKQVEALDREYCISAQEYRDLITQYSHIKDINNLADLYTIKQILSQTYTGNQKILNIILANISPNLKLIDFSWQIDNLDLINLYNSSNTTIINANYVIYMVDESDSPDIYDKLSREIEEIEKVLPEYDVKYIWSVKESYIAYPHKITPVKIILTNKD